MSHYTIDEFNDALLKAYNDPEDDSLEGVLEELAWDIRKEGLETEEGVFKLEEQHGGEGQGDRYYIVISFTKGSETQYVKYETHYDSWQGTDWSDALIAEVEPQEKVIRVWEEKSGSHYFK